MLENSAVLAGNDDRNLPYIDPKYDLPIPDLCELCNNACEIKLINSVDIPKSKYWCTACTKTREELIIMIDNEEYCEDFDPKDNYEGGE